MHDMKIENCEELCSIPSKILQRVVRGATSDCAPLAREISYLNDQSFPLGAGVEGVKERRRLIQKLFLFFNLISVVKNPSLHPKYVRHVQNRIHYVIHGNTNRIAQSFGTSCVHERLCTYYMYVYLYIYIFI